MGVGKVLPLRALPRAFVEGIDGAPESIDLPAAEVKKFRNILRLSSGDEVAILPGDGRVLRCQLQGKHVDVVSEERPDNDPNVQVTLALALSKPDTLENSVRMATEMGVAAFIIFPSQRSVVKWSDEKYEAKLNRLRSIAREASEVCFRTKLPTITVAKSLKEVLAANPTALVMSESDQVFEPLKPKQNEACYVIGPEGGWAPPEIELIGDRARTLGKLVFRVDTAVAATAAVALLS